jgi:hypothetical protein
MVKTNLKTIVTFPYNTFDNDSEIGSYFLFPVEKIYMLNKIKQTVFLPVHMHHIGFLRSEERVI